MMFRGTVWISLAAAVATSVMAAEPDDERFFRERIEPVLKAECYGCHSAKADKVEAGLLLDSRSGLLRGGDTGAAVVVGKSRDSLLIAALRHEQGLAMPPDQPRLADQIIADFVRWIDRGAVDPRPDVGPVKESDELRAARQHWAFQPVRKLPPPSVAQPEWSQSPIDAFILAELEAHNWKPAPLASREELIRRVTFDVWGLPPTPEAIDEFLRDSSPEAYERLVDRLLSSPHYGERMAQQWLDVVRFAETEGYEYDRHLPDAWRYRDYVIAAFNDDKPFDRFLQEQIAGDELDPDNAECLTASIFHRLGPVRRNAGNPDIALSRNEVLTERTDILGAAVLGLTVGCARCHNHKLEPISQRDYYRLQAYFAATDEHNISLASPDEQHAWDRETAKTKTEIDRLKQAAKKATGSERDRLTDQIEALEDQLPAPLATIPSTRNDPNQTTPIHVLRRGVWELKGERVGPRPLSVLVADDLPELAADVPQPRTQLARWLTATDHPLTSRVIVNRLWQHHFGVGLVKSANDFGVRGERPSHPALLNWLAATLIEHNGSLKALHRSIVLSQTYRQSSRSPSAADYADSDPENRLLWRFPRRRLTAEETRDAMLAVSGRLNARVGGPSVMVPVDPELIALLYKPSQWQVTADPREHDRRSIYLIAKRNLRLPFFDNLDAPPLQSSCARRESSTHAPQALELLNGTLSNDLAQALARRLKDETDGSPEQLVEHAYRLVLGRLPTDSERTASQKFVREQPLSEFALALFNLNGFLYVP
ncbi:MAG TPA: PSD1 and planctomycete cytochrome C domain-containing protein [Planctomycetaceae bacterium]|nr:PSD1 and planctomycete cytochrome C domain-containing protein [Planctomycetaceae bacterium]